MPHYTIKVHGMRGEKRKFIEESEKSVIITNNEL